MLNAAPATFAWDDQQLLLDELLLEIFTPGAPTPVAADLDYDYNDTPPAHSAAYASSPQGLKRGASSAAGSPDGPGAAFPALSPLKKAPAAGSPTASSSSDEGSAFSGPGCSPGGLDLAERHVASGAAAAMTVSVSARPTGAALLDAFAQLRVVEDAFRRENALLAHEIDRYEQAFVAVQDVVAELREQEAEAAAANRAAAAGAADSDHFAWTARVTALLPQVQSAEILAFVARSVDEVLQQVRASQQLAEAEHTILGWRVRRAVAGEWIRFAVSKDFAHEDVDAVAHKTWFVQSQSQTVNATMPQHHLMKVLRVVNDNALICARNLFFPGDATNYCTIYLLMRVATPRGYVIAQRSLVPTDAALLRRLLGPGFSYVNLFYGMILERPAASDAVGDAAAAGPSGCSATFGGVATNGTEEYVNTSAKDVFVAMLRWESVCIGPLYRLL
ncbi:hypothetical protein PybrP1_003591 [[Pythium] brassicae (nom. inval.)]|nr:hypothetical protein PybrP1_003591 [[Pythium] brassicae (nom. inval.)]